jgi:cytoskeletal protein RodZ
MTIEGLGKKFQEARIARKLTLDEAARMTKIRPSRLAEIEADDFSQFPSLTYAKGFLQIYGKFLDVDVSPYMEAFEGSDAVTVDGYSYLQDNPAPKPVRTPVVPRRPPPSMRSSGKPTSLMPLFIGIAIIALGMMGMKFILNLRRIAPSRVESTTATAPTPAFTIAPPPSPSIQPTVAARAVASATVPPIAATATPPATTPAPTAVAVASASPTAAPPQPEVRRAEPVAPEDLAKAAATSKEGSGPNKIAIRPLKKTYVKVVVDNDTSKAPFERWISPADGPVEFRGQHFAIRVLDREAVQIKKNGKSVTDDDSDVTIE